VKFNYGHKTHWVTDDRSSVIATAVGDFQSELGCAGDWQPDRSAVADPGGSFSIQVAVSGGTSVLNTCAVSPSSDTAHDQRSVFGPGNYAYPTASDFHAGAFDLQDFQVWDSGSDVTFRVQTRDLSPTFGSPLGAQLVDVHVHAPGASPTSNAAANGPTMLRNFSIAPAFAWSRLIQVQGFGQRYVDAQGNTVGTVGITANALSRFIPFTVSKASLGGTPGSGWSFVVVLTGQDGFGDDQARAFQARPQPYSFGVCAAPSTDPHCTASPSSVPKAMDVITPPGVLQSTELDYTLDPVVLQGVTIPLRARPAPAGEQRKAACVPAA